MNNLEKFKASELAPKASSINPSTIVFHFPNGIFFDSHMEDLSAEVEELEDKMMELGFDGAITGHPLDQGDSNYIYFEFEV